MSMVDTEGLVAQVTKLTGEHHWRLQLTHDPTPHIITAAIHLGNWQICINIAPAAEELLLKRNISLPAQRLLVSGLVFHELGHNRICPFDNIGKCLILENAAQAIAVANKEPEDEELIAMLANVVSDVIVDTVGSLEEHCPGYADGHGAFFLKQTASMRQIDRAYCAFIRLNMLLWGHLCHYRKKLDTFVKPLLGPDILARIGDLAREIQEDACGQLVEYLSDRRNWPGLTRLISHYFLTIITEEDSVSFAGRADVFAKPFANLYKGRGERLALRVAGSGAHAQESLPWTPLTTRPVDPLGSLDPARMVWSATKCYPSPDRRGRLQLEQQDYSLSLPIGVKSGQGYLPDLSFWLDSSGSMGFDPYAGRGRYDLLLRTVFAVFSWLTAEKLATYLRYSILNFSAKTEVTGWQSWQRREKLYDVLFHYQEGWTELNLDKAKALTTAAERPFKVIMVTDGEIHNGDTLLDFLQENFRSKPDHFVLIQLGFETDFSRAVCELGLPVHFIHSQADFASTVMGEIAATYRVAS